MDLGNNKFTGWGRPRLGVWPWDGAPSLLPGLARCVLAFGLALSLSGCVIPIPRSSPTKGFDRPDLDALIPAELRSSADQVLVLSNVQFNNRGKPQRAESDARFMPGTELARHLRGIVTHDTYSTTVYVFVAGPGSITPAGFNFEAGAGSKRIDALCVLTREGHLYNFYRDYAQIGARPTLLSDERKAAMLAALRDPSIPDRRNDEGPCGIQASPNWSRELLRSVIDFIARSPTPGSSALDPAMLRAFDLLVSPDHETLAGDGSGMLVIKTTDRPTWWFRSTGRFAELSGLLQARTLADLDVLLDRMSNGHVATERMHVSSVTLVAGDGLLVRSEWGEGKWRTLTTFDDYGMWADEIVGELASLPSAERNLATRAMEVARIHAEDHVISQLTPTVTPGNASSLLLAALTSASAVDVRPVFLTSDDSRSFARALRSASVRTKFLRANGFSDEVSNGDGSLSGCLLTVSGDVHSLSGSAWPSVTQVNTEWIDQAIAAVDSSARKTVPAPCSLDDARWDQAEREQVIGFLKKVKVH